MVASPPISPSTSPESSSVSGRSGTSANLPVCRQQADDIFQHFPMAQSSGGHSKLAAPKLVPITLQNQPLPSAHLLAASSGSQLHPKRQRNGMAPASNRGNQENGAINLSVKDNLERNNNNDRRSVSVFDGSEFSFGGSDVADGGQDDDRGKKRRRQTSVPEQNKDQRYWVRRLKNNEAAKRSRDMRIQREKVLFDENARLEARSSELLLEKLQLLTDNKELELKMDLILGENARLKAIIQSLQQQLQHQDLEFNGSASQSPL